MPIQFKEENSGKLLIVDVNGKLTKTDYEHFVPEFDRLIQQQGKLRLLFDLTDFHGWEVSAMWEEIEFDVAHFADIEKLAMVGDTKWEQGMATFCKPFTTATIRYFDRTDTTEARQWLDDRGRVANKIILN